MKSSPALSLENLLINPPELMECCSELSYWSWNCSLQSVKNGMTWCCFCRRVGEIAQVAKKKASARNDVPMRRNRFHSHLYQLQPFRINQNGPPFEASEQKVLSAHSWKSCSVRRSALLHPVVHQRVHPGRRDLPPPGKELGKLGNCRYAAVKQTNLKYQVFKLFQGFHVFFET